MYAAVLRPPNSINMKASIKSAILDRLFRVYYPICLRVEKMKAVRMWRDGVRQCKALQKEIGAPRTYLFFDSKHMVWSPMTYEPNKKDKPAMRVFRGMGKVSGKNIPHDVETMKQYSYYYTASKWGAKAVDEMPKVKEEKLRLWIDYYLASLSEPMKKCWEYRRGYLSRCHPTAPNE